MVLSSTSNEWFIPLNVVQFKIDHVIRKSQATTLKRDVKFHRNLSAWHHRWMWKRKYHYRHVQAPITLVVSSIADTRRISASFDYFPFK